MYSTPATGKNQRKQRLSPGRTGFKTAIFERRPSAGGGMRGGGMMCSGSSPGRKGSPHPVKWHFYSAGSAGAVTPIAAKTVKSGGENIQSDQNERPPAVSGPGLRDRGELGAGSVSEIARPRIGPPVMRAHEINLNKVRKGGRLTVNGPVGIWWNKGSFSFVGSRKRRTNRPFVSFVCLYLHFCNSLPIQVGVVEIRADP